MNTENKTLTTAKPKDTIAEKSDITSVSSASGGEHTHSLGGGTASNAKEMQAQVAAVTERIQGDHEANLQAQIAAARERRNRMVSSGDDVFTDDRLALPTWVREKYEAEKVHLCFVNDVDGGVDNFKNRGYFVINEEGVETKRHAGQRPDGQPYYTVLMGIPQDLFEADRAKETEQTQKTLSEIGLGNGATAHKDDSNFYVPKGNKVGERLEQ